MTLNQRILSLGNDAGYFLSHRLPKARAARDAGYEVHVVTPLSNEVDRIKLEWFEFHSAPLKRWELGVREESLCFSSLSSLSRSVKPHFVYQVTIQAVLNGGMAARLANVPTNGVQIECPNQAMRLLNYQDRTQIER